MDGERFDRLTKAFGQSGSRRTLIKTLLGIGGLAAIGTAARDQGPVEAARRPAGPTPTPIKCPGNQLPSGGTCICPAGLTKCGPDCCNTTDVPLHSPGYSECCDNECCFGTCTGEESCCPTNQRSNGSAGTLPAIASVCANGECCLLPKVCANGVCVNPTPTPTNTPTATDTPRPPTNTPTSTPTNTPQAPTNTPTATATNTSAPATSTPTATPTNQACSCQSGETCCPTAAGGFVCCPPSGTCEDNSYIEYTCSDGECVRGATSCDLDDECQTGICLQNQGCFQGNVQNGSSCGNKGICCDGSCSQCCGTDTSNCEAFGYDAECVVCFQGTACSDGGTEFLACFIDDEDPGWCNNGHCVACSGLGEECIESTQCCSNNCDGDTCAPPDDD